MKSLRRGLAFTIAAGALAACSTEDEETQITVAVTAETVIPAELDRLEIAVYGTDGRISVSSTVDARPGFFPATVAIIPRNEDSLSRAVRVELVGKLGDEPVVLRRAVVSFVEGRSLLLELPLRMACFSVKGCKENETCAGGLCQPANVTSATLPDYTRARVFAEGAPACFDEGRCLAGSTRATVDPATCSFGLPPASAGGARLNVSIRWAAAQGRIIVLPANDAIEGWTVAGDRGVLAPGICTSFRDPEPDPAKRSVPDRALEVWLSTDCDAKAASLPFCASAAGNVSSGVGVPGG